MIEVVPLELSELSELSGDNKLDNSNNKLENSDNKLDNSDNKLDNVENCDNPIENVPDKLDNVRKRGRPHGTKDGVKRKTPVRQKRKIEFVKIVEEAPIAAAPQIVKEAKKVPLSNAPIAEPMNPMELYHEWKNKKKSEEQERWDKTVARISHFGRR